MPELTAEQLLLLEQLTYLDGSGIPVQSDHVPLSSYSSNGLTLGEILDGYDFSSLKSDQDYGVGTTGRDWQDLLNAIQADPQLRDLRLYRDSSHELSSESGGNIALVFYDKDNPDQAIVAFRGTADTNEWEDNLDGAGLTDTPAQQRALEFINDLPFDSVTVTGHSKGANKANYVALLSDKVSRSIAFDGQGFSPQFYAKYPDRVKANAYKITCYSMCSDFVHELLYEIPGAEYIFVIGSHVESLAENHVLHKLLTKEDGSYTFKTTTSELPEVSKLRELANYLITTASRNGDLDELVQILDVFIVILTDDNLSFKEKISQILACAESPLYQDQISLLLAYFIRYINDYHVSREDICALVRYFGLDPDFTPVSMCIDFSFFIKDQLSDEDGDYLSKFLISLVPNTNISSSILNIWSKAEQDYRQLPAYDRSRGILYPTLTACDIYNYSASHLDGIHSIICSIEGASFRNIDNWRSYAGEDWYNSLLVDPAYQFIHNYYTGLSDLNVSCKSPIDSVFASVYSLDSRCAAQMSDLNMRVRQLTNAVQGLAQGTAPASLPSFPESSGTYTYSSSDSSSSLHSAEGVGAVGAAASGPLYGYTVSNDILGYSTKVTSKGQWDLDKGDVAATVTGKLEGHLVDSKQSWTLGPVNGEAEAAVGIAAVSGAVGLTLFHNNVFQPSLTGQVKAETSAAKGKLSGHLGSDANNIHTKVEGSLLSADAYAKAGIGMITVKGTDGQDQTALGVTATAGAEAYVAKGSISGGFSILGIKIDATLEGKAGGAGVKAGGTITQNGVTGSIGAGIGIGTGLCISIDWSNFEWPKFF